MQIRKGEYLFVYGTLRRGENSDLSRNSSQIDYLGQDRINGFLYNLGWYPGVREAAKSLKDGFDPDKPTVIGDVFRIRDAGIGVHLDAYEGYPNLYGRSEVMTEKGTKAWVYTYNDETAPDRLIETGDWKSVPADQPSAA